MRTTVTSVRCAANSAGGSFRPNIDEQSFAEEMVKR